MDKQKIKDKIKELEALLEDETKQYDKKLKLNTGNFRMRSNGEITIFEDSKQHDVVFNSFRTFREAEIASERMSAQNELLQMAFILNGDWKPDWKGCKKPNYYVYYDYSEKVFKSHESFSWGEASVYFAVDPIEYFLATASDNLKAYIKGELQ